MNQNLNEIWNAIETSQTLSAITAGVVLAFLALICKLSLKLLKKVNDLFRSEKKYSVGTEIQKKNAEATNIELSDSQLLLVERVNKVHQVNGINYDFEQSYKDSLNHINNKPAADWYNSAALHMANAIQNPLGPKKFFESFKKSDDPAKNQEFDSLEQKIRMCYERLQNLRHADKTDELQDYMIPKYERVVREKPEVSEAQYEQIFADFQFFLLELFRNYELNS